MRTTLILFTAALLAVAGGPTEMLATPKTGVHWYRMTGEGGEPIGYARLVVESLDGGGISASWTMKLAFPGGKYEEERKVILDGAFRLVAAGYVSDGETVSDARWTAEAPAPADSATAVIFLWAAMMPLAEGAVLVRSELDEAKGFASLGATRFVCEAMEEDGTFRVRMAREDGRGMAIWVTADREVAKIDWGGTCS